MTEKEIKNIKNAVLESVRNEFTKNIRRVISESSDNSSKNNSDQTILKTKFCGIDGITLLASKEKDSVRCVFFFQKIDDEKPEYDVYCTLYDNKTGNIRMIKKDEKEIRSLAEQALKESGAGRLEIRDVYSEKDDLKSFFENWPNCPVESIFITMRSVFGFKEKKDEKKNENKKEGQKENLKEAEEPKEKDAEKKDGKKKKPGKEHAKAIHDFVDECIKDEKSFIAITKLFGYIAKNAKKDGYEKALNDIINQLK